MARARRAAAFLVGLWVALGAAAAAAQAPGSEKRVALVIGNGAYQAGATLVNPVNDARAMAAKLKALGFDVIAVENGTHQMMRQAVVQFSNKLGSNGVSLFYYAGHGMQVGGRNYLIPVDADITTEQTVRLVTLDADAVIEQMSMAKSRINLVILDACRNNPFERRFRSQSGGLATVEAPTGTLIAYATSPGKVAADGDSGNGLYTSELVRAVDTPGAKVEEVFKQVRAHVIERSKGDQTPWEASSLTGDFYFNGPATVVVAPQPASNASGSADRDALFWSSVKDSRNPIILQTYLDEFPQGTFAGLAKAMIEELKRSQVASVPAKSDVAPPVDNGPAIDEVEGAYITLKRTNLREKPLAEAKLVKALDPGVPLTVTGKVKGTEWFRVVSADGKLHGFVFGDAIQDAKTAEDADWQRIKDTKQSAVVGAFLRRFPLGIYADQAKALRDELAKNEQAALILAAEQKAEADRQAEEKRKAQRMADEQRAAAAAEAKRQDEAREAQRRAEAERAAEAQRQAEAARLAEEQRRAAAAEEDRKRAEAERQAAAERQRQAAETEAKRKADDAARAAQEEAAHRQAAEAEADRKARAAAVAPQVAAIPVPLGRDLVGTSATWQIEMVVEKGQITGKIRCFDTVYNLSAALDSNSAFDTWARSVSVGGRPPTLRVAGTLPTISLYGPAYAASGPNGGYVGGTLCNSEKVTLRPRAGG